MLRALRKAKGLVFKPGERYEYSNSGYAMLALLVERVTGKRFAAFMRDEVFLSAGMERTVAMDLPAPHIDRRVTGYGDWPIFKEFDYSNLNYFAGDDGIYCSLDDFERWAKALENYRLVRPDTMRKVYSPVKANNGKTINYGYGWDLGKHKKLTLYSHGGSWVGFRTFIGRFPEKRVWIVVLGNSCSVNAWPLYGEVLDHCTADLA